MISRFAIAALLVLSGCAAYDPPMAGDHTTQRYQLDLQRCHKQVDTAAARAANATPQSAIRSAFASEEPGRAQMRSCMQARGYTPAGPAT